MCDIMGIKAKVVVSAGDVDQYRCWIRIETGWKSQGTKRTSYERVYSPENT